MIELSQIHKVFGGKVALGGVSMTIAEGESVAIVGESGSGKTTLGRILLRLIEPSQGEYRFEGRSVLGLRGAELRLWRHGVQAVFQNPWQSLNPRLRVDRLITEPIEAARGLGTKRLAATAGELLELVGLSTQLSRRYPHQLSGGQRQRVAIARAVSIRPRLLVLDEVASALDVSVRAQILNLLRELIKEFGMTVAYITHDLATVPYLCARAYVLYEGLVFEELPSSRLVSQPDNPYTSLLLGAVLTVGAHADLERPDRAGTLAASASGCRFWPRCPHVQAQCREVAPDLEALRAGGRSRCHFAGGPKPEAPKLRAQAGAGWRGELG
jgi:oligopeptide/dipeptide ABC transporter ATP-binding protein